MTAREPHRTDYRPQKGRLMDRIKSRDGEHDRARDVRHASRTTGPALAGRTDEPLHRGLAARAGGVRAWVVRPVPDRGSTVGADLTSGGGSKEPIPESVFVLDTARSARPLDLGLEAADA